MEQLGKNKLEEQEMADFPLHDCMPVTEISKGWRHQLPPSKPKGIPKDDKKAHTHPWRRWTWATTMIVDWTRIGCFQTQVVSSMEMTCNGLADWLTSQCIWIFQ